MTRCCNQTFKRAYHTLGGGDVSVTHLEITMLFLFTRKHATCNYKQTVVGIVPLSLRLDQTESI